LNASEFKWWQFEGLEIDGDALVAPNLFGEEYEPPAILYLDFAELEETPEAVLAFAEKYGPLGIGERDEDGTRREPLGVWYAEARIMRLLIEFWDLVEELDSEALEKLLNENEFASLGGDAWDPWADLPGVRTLDDGTYSVPRDVLEHYGPHVEVGTREQLKGTAKNLGQVTREDACRTILERRLTAALQWGVRHVYSGSEGLALKATNLRGFLWLQLALAVDGNRQYRRCRECGKLYERARSDREYCGDACKQRAHRKKVAKAVAAVGEGQPVDEVAKSFGTKAETLEGWVKAAKKKPAKHARSKRGTKGGSNA